MLINIVTVSSSSFLNGTIDLFKSILKNNPKLSFQFLIINAGLTIEEIQSLEQQFNGQIISPSRKLTNQIKQVCDSFNQLKKERFYSLEMFNYILPNETCVFLDSDIVCCDKLNIISNLEDGIWAVPDRAYYGGFKRDKKSFKIVENNKITKAFPQHFIPKLFNTGVIIFKNTNGKGLMENVHKTLTPKTFKPITTGHTDTVVFNKILLNEVKWLPIDWNVYTTMLNENKISPNRILFLHFAGKDKPWNLDYPKESKSYKLWLKEK